MEFEPQPLSTNAEAKSSEEFVKHMEALEANLKAEMLLAQARYEVSANRHGEPSPVYKVGDQVWLSTRNIKTLRPSQKLDWKRIGRFSIKKIISPYEYKLDLPETMTMHPVFYVFLLDPVATDLVPGQILPPSPPFEVDDTGELEVAEILDSRKRHGRVKYYIQ